MSVPRWPGASTLLSPPDVTPSPCSRSRPDILRDTESRLGESMLPPASPPSTAEKTKKSLPLLLEDPVRRRYKAILTVTFIATSGLYIVVDVIFQVTTSSVSAKFYEPFRSRVRSPRATSPQHLLRTSHRWHSHYLLAPQKNSLFLSFTPTPPPSSWRSRLTRRTWPPPSTSSSSPSRSSTHASSSTQSSAQNDSPRELGRTQFPQTLSYNQS